jgi:hypothetical protein
MESTAGGGALDSLSGFIHGDATDLLTMGDTIPSRLQEKDVTDLYRKPDPGNGSVGTGLPTES